MDVPQPGGHHSINDLKYHHLAPIQNARKCCWNCSHEDCLTVFSMTKKLDTKVWWVWSPYFFNSHDLACKRKQLQEIASASLPPSKHCLCATIRIPYLHPDTTCKRVWERLFSAFNHHEIEWSWTGVWGSHIKCLWQAGIVMHVDLPAVSSTCSFISFMVFIKFMSYILFTSPQPC